MDGENVRKGGKEMRFRCEVNPPNPLLPVAGKKAVPGIKRDGELSLSLTGCRTWENRNCILCGQYTRADPIGCDAGEPTLRALEYEK